jgi:hypothetical protein
VLYSSLRQGCAYASQCTSLVALQQGLCLPCRNLSWHQASIQLLNMEDAFSPYLQEGQRSAALCCDLLWLAIFEY